MTNHTNTQKEIEKTACMLFGTNGFVATSMAEIARIVGVTKASLYYFFQDKSELFLVVLARALEQAHEVVKEVRETHEGDAILRETIHQLIKTGQSNQVFGNMPDFQLIKKHKKRLQDVQNIMESIKNELKITLRNAGIKQEDIAVEVLLNSIHGYVKHCEEQENTISAEEYGNYLADILMNNKSYV